MIYIKKAITALGENVINEKLKKEMIYEIIGNDIPYQDGVIDILEGNSLIEVLFLSETLIGEYEIKEFINKIKKISPDVEIIFFMSSNDSKLEIFLQSNGISKIYKDGENTIDEIINKLSDNFKEYDLTEEIERLKKLLEEKQERDLLKSKLKIENRVKLKNTIKKDKNKVIAISGNYNSGKSLITSLLAMTYKMQSFNVLIIDFDIFNKAQEKLFGIHKNINNSIIKVSNGLSLFTNLDLIFNNNNKITIEKVNTIINDLKKDYEIILIDTSSEINLKFTKAALKNVDKIIFLTEGNLLELKKSKNLLEVYINDWEISPYKFNILMNKINKFSIEKEIIKDIFENMRIIGEINFKNEYTSYINNCLKGYINTKQYLNIIKKI